MFDELSDLRKKRINRRWVVDGMGAAAAVPTAGAILGTVGGPAAAQDDSFSESVNDIVQSRELSPDDVSAALETYMPTGKIDEYMMFASSGHAGQVFAVGVPSMRLVRTIAAFTPSHGWATASARKPGPSSPAVISTARRSTTATPTTSP